MSICKPVVGFEITDISCGYLLIFLYEAKFPLKNFLNSEIATLKRGKI